MDQRLVSSLELFKNSKYSIEATVSSENNVKN